MLRGRERQRDMDIFKIEQTGMDEFEKEFVKLKQNIYAVVKKYVLPSHPVPLKKAGVSTNL